MSRGNSLSGLTLQQIVTLVKNVLVKDQMMQQPQPHVPVSYILLSLPVMWFS